MADQKILLGFYGPGDSTTANTAELLDDFLDHEDEITVVVPAAKRPSKGIQSVYDWIMEGQAPLQQVIITGDEDLPRDYPEEDLADARDDDPFGVVFSAEADEAYDKVFLIVLWGEDGDEATESLVLSAQRAVGIKVLDLTSGLDVIVLAPPAAEPAEDEATAPAPAPLKKKRPSVAEKAAEAAEAAVEAPPPDDERAAAPDNPDEDAAPRSAREIREAIEATTCKFSDEERAADRLRLQSLQDGAAYEPVDLPHDGGGAHVERNYLTEFEESYERMMAAARALIADNMERAVQHEQEMADLHFSHTGERTPAEAPAKTRGRPRKDGSPAQPRDTRVRVLVDASGQVIGKRGSGRPPADTTTLSLDPEEYAVLAGHLGLED